MGSRFSKQSNASKHQTIEKSLELLSSYSNLEEGLVSNPKKINKPKGLTLFQLLTVLRPYFWPDTGTDGAFINRVRSSATWLLVGLSKASSLIAPFYLIAATDDIQTNNWKSAIINVAIFCGLKLGSSIFKELQGLVYIKVKQQASIELLELTFKHIHSLSLSWHLTKKTGTVVKSMDRGTDAANTLVTYMFLYLIPALAECLAVVILFFIKYKQWSLGLTVFTGVFAYIVITVIITRWRQKFREATNKHDNDYHDKATDSIINFETVKYFTAEEFELQRFKESVVRYQKYNSSTQIANSSLNISQQFVLYATLFVAMVLSSRAVINDQMSIGEWVAVQSWVATIFVPLNFLGGVYNAIVQALVDVRNLSEMLSEVPDMVDEPTAVVFPKPNKSIGASVEFSNVSFHYPEQPKEKGLKKVSFVVKAGTTTAIVGSTGSGKTTTSRLLFRFYDPLEGAVLIDNKNIKNFTQKSIRDLIGVVPQDTVLFNDTILYNIRYGKRDATMNEVIAAAESAQIKQFIDSLPDGWNTMVGERGLKLSGGEKQRVAIARCLLKDPPIVLLDEATSALDTVTEYSVQEALYTLGVNRTVIMIAHRLSTVKNANQIIVLDNGNIVEKGSHDELLQNDNGIYSKLWNMQIMSSGLNESNILETKSESKNEFIAI